MILGNTKEFDAFVTEDKHILYLQNEYGLAKFDFLINNAGTGGHTAFVDATEDEFDTMVNIHFKVFIFLHRNFCHI